MQRIFEEYDEAFDKYGDSTVAALLVLAHSIRSVRLDEDASHWICMGIRHGLFGAKAEPYESVLGLAEVRHDIAYDPGLTVPLPDASAFWHF